jgi:hypothetical protein
MLPVTVTETVTAATSTPAVADRQEAAASRPGEPESPRVETELVASTVFQSGLVSLRLGSPLVLDAHWLGLDGTNAGVLGFAWEFRRGGWRILPGLAWGVLEDGRPAPAAMVRWAFDSERWISQGALVLALRAQSVERSESSHESAPPVEEVYGHILDGVHVSRVVGAFELGPFLEQVRYREENEWLGGARLAWRAGRGLKAITQILAPDPEVRIGLSWEYR